MAIEMLLGQRTPERGNIDDGNPLDFSEDQQTRIGANEISRLSGNGALQELIVGGIPAQADRDRRIDENGPPSEKIHQRSGFYRVQTKLLEDLEPAENGFDLGEDRPRQEENEPAIAPGLVDSGCEAVSPGDGPPQEDLGVKNDSRLAWL